VKEVFSFGDCGFLCKFAVKKRDPLPDRALYYYVLLSSVSDAGNIYSVDFKH